MEAAGFSRHSAPVIHGSALDIAGKGFVNPLASIESARLMLEYFGEEKAAASLLRAQQKVLKERLIRTRDMGGTNSTQEMGEAVRAALEA